jgi:pantetheine-phosphate adenylyltransferase
MVGKLTMNSHRIGVYPGTFDPITNGHRDIIHRSSKVCDKLVVGVAQNAGKEPLFTAGERADMARTDLLDAGVDAANVEIKIFDNLLMDFATQEGATCILRGLRAVSDFEYEFHMASMNRRLNTEVETVFLIASEQHLFIASSLVKEIGRLGGDISSFVSATVAKKVLERLAEPKLHAVND